MFWRIFHVRIDEQNGSPWRNLDCAETFAGRLGEVPVPKGALLPLAPALRAPVADEAAPEEGRRHVVLVPAVGLVRLGIRY